MKELVEKINAEFEVFAANAAAQVRYKYSIDNTIY